MSTDDEALAVMIGTFVAHERLRTRWRSAGAPPITSELARADRVWPRLPYTEHGRQALAAAWDHFDLVRLTIDQRRTFPTGLNGVLRGALVASATALWLLGPQEASDRDGHGLALSDEWYRRRIQYQRDLLDAVEDDHSGGKEQLAMLQADRDAVKALRDPNVGVGATDIIDWSAAHRYGEGTMQHKAALLEWERLGGDAHALGWQMLLQSVAWERPRPGAGPVQAQITGSLRNVAEPYMCAWGIFTRALDRFDELWATPAA